MVNRTVRMGICSLLISYNQLLAAARATQVYCIIYIIILLCYELIITCEKWFPNRNSGSGFGGPQIHVKKKPTVLDLD
jgi:hypothetical protein